MIGWRDKDGRVHRGTLFAVFAALARGEAWSFPALRSHQREPWHAFTVQVAALALIRAGVDALPTDEAAWRDLLLALSDGVSEAWELVVDDWSKPALLQPPVVAAANRAEYKNRLPTPDALDMLVTAKNHDVKQERIAEASEEDWLFALVTLQTTEGFLGAGNYGISRMNGGFASRMSLGIRPGDGGAAAAFRRDVLRLIGEARGRADRRAGTALLWTVPWDGTVSLGINTLDELYVEVCRRVRLERTPDGVGATGAGSKVARVAAAGGYTQDPWAPLIIDTKKGRDTEGKPISVSPTGAGFGYRQLAHLLSKKVTPPLLAKVHDSDDRNGLSIVASALVRGQGKTEGLHRRAVRTSRMGEFTGYSPQEALDRIGDIAGLRAKDAGEAGRRLQLSLIMLVQGGPEQARLNDDAAKKKVQSWVDGLNDRIDREFFDAAFWAEAVNEGGGHKLAWRRRLRDIADTVFDEAAEAAPRTEMRRIRAKARAKSTLDGLMNKWLGEVPDGE